MLLKLARYAGLHGRYGRAAELADRARFLEPDDPEVGLIAADIIAQTIPSFHIQMMRDAPRNAAFEAALRRNVRPGIRVLDVGSGSGLLAMMAARAGATDIWSCELQAPVAAVAKEIVADNGFADRITILAKHSDEIDAGADMGGLADLVVAEIISSDIVSEQVLPSMRDVVRRLARPGARLIPRRAEIRVALAQWDDLDQQYVGDICGFDLSPFNRLVKREFHLPVDSNSLSLSGPSQALFSFDFAVQDQGADYTQILLESDGRPANGVVQWIYLQMDETGSYENRPGQGAGSSWDAYFHPLAGPITPAPGTTISVAATHRGNRLRLWTPD